MRLGSSAQPGAVISAGNGHEPGPNGSPANPDMIRSTVESIETLCRARHPVARPPRTQSPTGLHRASRTQVPSAHVNRISSGTGGRAPTGSHTAPAFPVPFAPGGKRTATGSRGCRRFLKPQPGPPTPAYPSGTCPTGPNRANRQSPRHAARSERKPVPLAGPGRSAGGRQQAGTASPPVVAGTAPEWPQRCGPDRAGDAPAPFPAPIRPASMLAWQNRATFFTS